MAMNGRHRLRAGQESEKSDARDAAESVHIKNKKKWDVKKVLSISTREWIMFGEKTKDKHKID